MKMPHAHSGSAASSGGDDLGSTDEVKVFKDEGDGEDEKRSSENLLEEKSSLIDWTESEEKSGEPYSGKLSVKSDLSPVFGKFEPHPAASFNMGYLVTPYPYANGGAHPLPVSMILITLAFYATGSYQTLVGQSAFHSTSQTTVSRAVRQVTEALNQPRIYNKYIKWPTRREHINSIKARFYSKFQIPGVLGCIDGTHVAVIRPVIHEERYYNRKGYHSLNVMIICDSELNILCVDASSPGSAHDSSVWASHPLNQHLNVSPLYGEQTFLLGDSGYPLRKTMMTPILNTLEGSPEHHYYIKHVSARNVVERCIGVLKARFRCLLAARELHYDPIIAGKMVNACCVLHNIATSNRIPVPILTPEELNAEHQRQIQAGKMGLPAGGSLSLFCPGGDLGQPPPAHMGIPPPYQLDSKLAAGLARTPMYPFPGGAYPYPMLSPEMSQVAASWHTPSMYPITSAASGFRSPYPTSLPIPSSTLSSELYRFSPTLGGGLGLGLGPALVPPPTSKADIDSYQSRFARSLDKGSSSSASDKPAESSASSNSKEQNKKPHIKKPLNAFMLYMKEMRAKVVAECTLKESAAINQILGRRWHSLSREEQAKYYEKARQERQLHMQLYPGWSARDNYGYGSKKKKRKKDRSPAELGGSNLKKCRARYGLEQQNQWCKPCRRKKKCVRYMEALAAASALPMPMPQSPCSDEDVKLEELSDAFSDGEGDADTPLNSASSPGGLSALSSLASPAPEPPARHPVGTNPRDANNPLSVGQLTSPAWPRAARPPHEAISVS